MGIDSNNFFLVVGPITVYILIEFGLAIFNEIVVASIIRCRSTKGKKEINPHKSDEVQKD